MATMRDWSDVSRALRYISYYDTLKSFMGANSQNSSILSITSRYTSIEQKYHTARKTIKYA